MDHQRRRECQVRPRHHQSRLRERAPQSGRPRALPQARPFPCRLAGSRHFHDQTRGPRSRPLLRQALQARPRSRLSRCRRRARCRLRRFTDQLRQLHELLPSGIRQRRRLEHHGRVRFGRRGASGDRERRRARDRGASLRPRRGSVRFDRKKRADGEGDGSRTRSQARPRHPRSAAETQAHQPPRKPARRAADQGRIAAVIFRRSSRPREQSEDRKRLLAVGRADRRFSQRGALRPGGGEGTRDLTQRSVHLQLLRLPIAPRPLGARPAFSHHADSSAEYAALAERHHGRHHLRFGREDLEVYRPPGREGNAAAASDHSR